MNPLLDILNLAPTAANPAGPLAPSIPTGVVPTGIFALALNAAVQQSILPITIDGTTPAPLTPARAEHAVASEQPQSPTSIESQPHLTVPPTELVAFDATVCAGQPLPSLVDPNTAIASPQAMPTQSIERAPQSAIVADIVTPVADQQLTAVLVETLGQPAQVPSQNAVAVTLPSTVDVSVDHPFSSDELVAALTQQTPTADTDGVLSDGLRVVRFAGGAQPAGIHQLKSQLQQQYPGLRIQSLDGHLQADATVRIQPPIAATSPTTQPAVVEVAALPLPLSGHPVVVLANQKKIGRPSTQPVGVVEAQPPTSGAPAESRGVKPAQAPLSGTHLKPLAVSETTDLPETLDQVLPSNASSGQSAFATVDKLPADTSGLMSKSPVVEIPDAERVHVSIKRVQIETLIKRGEIKLQLQPEHLGTVKVRLVTTPHETSARLETSSEEARRMVEVNLPQLRENFERAGLKLNQIEVVVSDDALARHSQAFARQPRQPRRQFIPAAVAESSAAATVATGLTALVSGLNLLA